MKANAIICEYNPFHNGHKYQIDCIKKNSHNPIVGIMSGNFTQRGDIAVFDKFKRAQYACENGVDLIIEMPTVYATSNAEIFACTGVEIANSLGCVENLCFSTEKGNDKYLNTVCEAFDKQAFIETIKDEMAKGTYYPKAVEFALKKLYSRDVSDIVKEPNNVLGVEYLKALKKTNIKPMIITRTGVGHDEERIEDNITSASNIRKMMENNNSYKEFIPWKIDDNNIALINNLEKVILYKLRCMTAEDFKNLPNVNEGLENRFINAIRSNNSLEEILNYIKTKRYTMARLRRIVIHALLGITKEMVNKRVPYIRILAFNNVGKELVSQISKHSTLPLITNVANGYNKLNENAKKIFDVDILATDLYSLATDIIDNTKKDFTKGIIKI